MALVTTLGGLAVAIPAAIFAHYFEGKITRLLTQVESEFRRLVPRFESVEGKLRYDLGPGGLRRRASAEAGQNRTLEPGQGDGSATARTAAQQA